MEKSSTSTIDVNLKNNDENFKLKAALFFSSLAGISTIIGFSSTLIAAKKNDPKYFNQGMTAGSIQMKETGASLAIRALGWGTLYSFTGCGILFFTIWKLSGAKNFEEFRLKVGSALPKISKNDPPQGRTEFSGLNDLLQYLSSQK